ncbi:MAG TPA: SIS domain-containing protein, partial [Rhodanobacteraceae bacterium]
QVEALGHPGDVLMALSTSGHSPNVIAAARAARERDCKVLVLTGGDGGALAPLADIALCVPSTTVARIQEVHDLCIHVLAEALEPQPERGQAP